MNDASSKLNSGDTCWYLSIGGQNNWYESEIENYEYCIASKNQQELVKVKKQIKSVLEKYSLSFYRVYTNDVVDFSEIIYGSLTDDCIKEQLENDSDNCFDSEDNAREAAKSLAEILSEFKGVEIVCKGEFHTNG